MPMKLLRLMCPERLRVTEAVSLDFILEVGGHFEGEAQPSNLCELQCFVKRSARRHAGCLRQTTLNRAQIEHRGKS